MVVTRRRKTKQNGWWSVTSQTFSYLPYQLCLIFQRQSEFLTKCPSHCTLFTYRVSEWLLLDANCAILQLYLGENQLHSMRWWSCPLCTRRTCLVLIVLELTETTVYNKTCRSTQTHISNCEPSGICSYSIMLPA